MSTWSQRYRFARLVLDQRELVKRARAVTDAEFGERVGKRLGREAPYSKSSVSQWGKEEQAPPVEVRRAIALECGVDPGWMDHGPDSQAPAPVGWSEPEPRKSGRMKLGRDERRGTLTAGAPSCMADGERSLSGLAD